jgi:hypothetical protein
MLSALKYWGRVCAWAWERALGVFELSPRKLVKYVVVYGVALAIYVSFEGVHGWLIRQLGAVESVVAVASPIIAFFLVWVWGMFRAPEEMERKAATAASVALAAVVDERDAVRKELDSTLAGLKMIPSVKDWTYWDKLDQFRLAQVSYLAQGLEPISSGSAPGSGYALFSVLKAAVRDGELKVRDLGGDAPNVGTLVERRELVEFWKRKFPDKQPRFLFAFKGGSHGNVGGGGSNSWMA